MHVIFLGPPGAGKGTVAARVKEEFHLNHLSTGDMLRAHMKEGTALGTLAKGYISEGKLVPDQVIIDMVADKIAHTEGGILFDGFPRTVEQAKALGEIAKIDAVVNLATTVDVVVDRICSRRLCRDCGAVYSVKWLKSDKCEACGGELYIRPDDNEETVRTRFDVYTNQTAPLIDYYERQGLVHTVDANDAIDNVVAKISDILKKA